MKVLIASKAHVIGTYQRKLEEIAATPGVELVAVAPDKWVEPRVGVRVLERRFTAGYRLEVLPLRLNGHFHSFWFAGLGQLIARERPDVVHMDEESFNYATYLGVRAAQRVGARACFYNWANIDRRYPPPFSLFERYTLGTAAHAIAGNQEAADIVRRHGYAGPVTVLPQFGVDEALFRPLEQPQPERPFVVAFFGRLEQSKGLLDLLDAVGPLAQDVRLLLVGSGPLEEAVSERAAAEPLAGRLEHRSWVPSEEVAGLLRAAHVLVLPSRTTPRWKEQFGRILVEAMASGVPVVGSSSGEIPHVIGDAGLTFPEGDVAALRERLQLLYADRQRWLALRSAGRERALARYTQRSLAAAYVEVYRQMAQR